MRKALVKKAMQGDQKGRKATVISCPSFFLKKMRFSKQITYTLWNWIWCCKMLTCNLNEYSIKVMVVIMLMAGHEENNWFVFPKISRKLFPEGLF